MSFFDDDPFEDIMRNFFGQSSGYSRDRSNEVISGESDERMIDFIETDKEAFLIFELPGYRKEDVNVEVSKTEIRVVAKRKVGESVAEYLVQKLSNGVELVKPLPKMIQKKKHELNFSNGVLELRFKK
ncbi:MAG: Hsp20 family protein [Candidatus Pacearchaeota archaeon]|nr:Hsp20 family protein [Candidatus Pacearchaeota archaeon]